MVNCHKFIATDTISKARCKTTVTNLLYIKSYNSLAPSPLNLGDCVYHEVNYVFNKGVMYMCVKNSMSACYLSGLLSSSSV